jgi:ribosomal protein L19
MATPSASKERSYNGEYMQVGKQAEEIVLSFLKSRPDVLGVNDFRDLRAVQEADIDFAIKTRDGRVTLAEVKSDRHVGMTGNILFEVLRINHTCISEKSCVLGWSARTPAQFILYYSPQLKRLYQFRSEQLRKAFQQYSRDNRKKMRIDVVPTDKIKTTINVLIPKPYWQNIVHIHDLSDFAVEVDVNGGTPAPPPTEAQPVLFEDIKTLDHKNIRNLFEES